MSMKELAFQIVLPEIFIPADFSVYSDSACCYPGDDSFQLLHFVYYANHQGVTGTTAMKI
jgi:hypothetical protein